GLGTSPLGGLFEAVSAGTARATVDRAWEMGVRYFDTAPLYGSGLAEERLGAALASRPRDEYSISTKVGRVLTPGEPSPHFVGAPLRPRTNGCRCPPRAPCRCWPRASSTAESSRADRRSTTRARRKRSSRGGVRSRRRAPATTFRFLLLRCSFRCAIRPSCPS